MKRPYIILNNCDNTPGCPVIEACPENIFYYDYNIKKLFLNNNKCIKCGICVLECEHEAVNLFEKNDIINKDKFEDEYGMALAQRIKNHYGIEPVSIYNDQEIEKLDNIELLNKKENILLYVYGNWKGESYIGYAFLKEMKDELKKEINNFNIYKVDYRQLNLDLSNLPAFITYINGNLINKYIGIKNPMYFLDTLIGDYINHN